MSWRRVFSSREAFVESKAGACPPDAYLCVEGEPGDKDSFDAGGSVELRARAGWPQEKPPPFAADDEDDEAPDE